jgi:hypothetical protein
MPDQQIARRWLADLANDSTLRACRGRRFNGGMPELTRQKITFRRDARLQAFAVS